MKGKLNFFKWKRDTLLFTLCLLLSGTCLHAETIPPKDTPQQKNIPQPKPKGKKLPGSCEAGSYWCAYKDANGNITNSDICIYASCTWSYSPIGCFLTYSEADTAQRYCSNILFWVDGIGEVQPNWVSINGPFGGCMGLAGCGDARKK